MSTTSAMCRHASIRYICGPCRDATIAGWKVHTFRLVAVEQDTLILGQIGGADAFAVYAIGYT
jgi:hypothetical protein